MKPSLKLALPALLGLAFAAALGGCGTETPKTAFELQLLHVSDADGSDTVALDSVANLSGLVAKYKAMMPNNTLVVSSGDNYIPGPRFNASDARSPVDMRALLGREGVGRADIAFLNAIGVQASAVGNHELDLGPGTFKDIITAGSGWSGAAFPYLAYNVDFSKDTSTQTNVGENGLINTELNGKLAGWTKVKVGSETIGVIGASSSTFPRITSTGGLVFAPSVKSDGAEDVDALAQVLQKGIDEITAAGINKVVMLAHMQKISTEKALASKLKGVDVIVAGGSNTLLSDSDDVLRAGDKSAGEYPYLTVGADGRSIAVVNVDADYKYLGRFLVPFDASGFIIPQRMLPKENGPIATSMTNDSAGGVTVNSVVVAIRDGLKAIINGKDGEYYGFSNVFIEGRRAFVRTEETNAGNIAADAQLWYAKQVDPTVQISLKNGGGIRAEIGKVLAPPGTTDVSLIPPEGNALAGRPAGAVSRLMLETSYKFNNSLWVFDVSASKLLAILNHGVADVENIGGRFPQVSGLAFSFDPSLPAGNRVRSIKVGDDVVAQNGAVVGNPDRVFRLVTMNFLATGGDNYSFHPNSSEKAAEADLPNLLKLNTPGVSDSVGGRVSTLPAGTEQDSLAEYLAQFHGTAAQGYSEADTPRSGDTRIQNLSQRSDTVLQ